MITTVWVLLVLNTKTIETNELKFDTFGDCAKMAIMVETQESVFAKCVSIQERID